ncbi:hypothetical protein FOA52_014551 [Chlamydomonas sp. UWO 241]|nr:hypothetical protein FOA52_014551 [Chlamydomonas sp. UWO 241]
MDGVALVGIVGFFGFGAAALATVYVAGLGVAVVASACRSCVSHIFPRSGSPAMDAASLPAPPAASPSSPTANQTVTAPKAADTLRVFVSAASTDSSCSSSMAGAAPEFASMAGAVAAPASTPVHGPRRGVCVARCLRVGALRTRTYQEVTAGVKASHVAVSKVNPATGDCITTTRPLSYANVVNNVKASMIVA